MDSFGSKLRQYRERKGMQIGVLARRLEVSTKYLYEVESGRRRPLIPQRIRQVATILELNLAEVEFLFLRRGLESSTFEIPYTDPGELEDHFDLRNRLAARLVAAWENLTQEQLHGIKNVLRGFPVPEQSPECPGPHCPLCSGEACLQCQPGTPCDHGTLERHEKP